MRFGLRCEHSIWEGDSSKCFGSFTTEVKGLAAEPGVAEE